jgi:hypothetical protein
MVRGLDATAEKGLGTDAANANIPAYVLLHTHE